MKKKFKKMVDDFATMQDFEQATKVQNALESNFCKKSDDLRLIEAVVTFDELTTANIYHVSITHEFALSQEAISVFSKSVRFLCERWIISKVGDTCTRFLVVSYLPPELFQNLFTIFFNKYKSSSVFNIIF